MIRVTNESMGVNFYVLGPYFMAYIFCPLGENLQLNIDCAGPLVVHLFPPPKNEVMFSDLSVCVFTCSSVCPLH